MAPWILLNLKVHEST